VAGRPLTKAGGENVFLWFPKTSERKRTVRAATGVRVAWSSRLVSVDPRWVPLRWHRRAIEAEGVRVHISCCDRIKHWDVLAALGLLDMVIKSSGSGTSLSTFSEVRAYRDMARWWHRH